MNKEDLRYRKSRDAIIEAGIRVLLSNPAAVMAEIALGAGVGRATLYRHFATRDELVRALTLLCLEETDALLNPLRETGTTGLPAIMASIDVLVPMADRFCFLMSLAAVGAGDREVNHAYQRQLDQLAELIVAGKEAGEIRQDLATEWIVASYDALLNAAWHRSSQRSIR